MKCRSKCQNTFFETHCTDLTSARCKEWATFRSWETQYFVLWPTNAQLFHKLSHSYMVRHYCCILRELVINILYTAYVKHLNCKMYYQQLHLKYLRNLASYWLQAPWGWHDSVETCRNVIICEIISYLLVIVRNISELFSLVAMYWLHAPWGWHDSVETCRSVIICEII